MTISSDKIERLVFVKYLLRKSEETKDLERPLSSTAILTLHDSVECFLQLSYEQLTGKTKLSGNLILDTYSEKINEILSSKNQQLINKSFIKRINELRNQLKHTTVFIDKRNIQNLHSETEIFLIDFSRTIFDIDFMEISLVQLISNEHVKRHLINADKKTKLNLLQEAMFDIGKAFYELEDLGTNVKGKHGENILSKHDIIDYLIKYKAQFGGQEPDRVLEENLKEIAEDINRLQDEIDDLKKVVSLSVDLKNYLKFRNIMPYVTKIFKGDTRTTEFWAPDEEKQNKVDYTLDQVKFCFEFVIDLALKNG